MATKRIPILLNEIMLESSGSIFRIDCSNIFLKANLEAFRSGLPLNSTIACRCLLFTEHAREVIWSRLKQKCISAVYHGQMYVLTLHSEILESVERVVFKAQKYPYSLVEFVQIQSLTSQWIRIWTRKYAF